MKTLYVAAFNWRETYNAWIEACSDDLLLLKEICKKWEENEKKYGNSYSTLINEVEISDGALELCKSAIILNIQPVIWFEVAIEESEDDSEDDFYSIEIIKIDKIIAPVTDEIPNNIFSAPFIRRK